VNGTDKRRILLVDDEPGFTRLLRLTLEAFGRYEVREVNDPREALAAARRLLPAGSGPTSSCRTSSCPSPTAAPWRPSRETTPASAGCRSCS
jgi:hypothetical protein